MKAEFVVLLRREIEDCLTRQGMQNRRGLNRKGLAKGSKERVLLPERARKQVSLDSEKEHAPHFEQQYKVYKDKAFSQELRLLACS